MKKGTKITVCLLAAAMMIMPALTGCAGNTGTTSGTDTAASSQESKKFDHVLVLKASGEISNDQSADINEILVKRMSAYGYNNNSVSSTGDTFTVSYDKAGDNDDAEEVANKLVKKGYVVFRGGNEKTGEALLDSSDIKTAEAVFEDNGDTKQYVIRITLNDESKDKFRAATEKYLSQNISLWVDDELISSPVVNEVINDPVIVLNSPSTFSDADTKIIAGNIAGALPVELTVVSIDKN